MTTQMTVKLSDTYPNVAAALEPKLEAFAKNHRDVSGHSARVADVLSMRPGSPEVWLRYDRGGDITTWLPSSRHVYYSAKQVPEELRDAHYAKFGTVYWVAVEMSVTAGEHATAV